MSTPNVTARVETWLSSTWHVKVPLTWLEACINWIQEENGGGNLSQAQINRQVFEQWLLTDLRDLEYPILPDGILDAPKGELSGFYSLQIDSLLDVSQPAYSQLQKIRGKSTVNEEVTANTQAFQKPWEAKPTRMLMLQLTDGIHQIQGMEYQPVPVLHSNLPPGTKITVHGNVAYRLGVLLLKPENVKLLGGEVDALLEEYSQERVLARLLGEAENPDSVRQPGHEQIVPGPVDELGQTLGPSDEELLASLDENNDFILNNETSLESGYCSRSNNFSATSCSLTTYNENTTGFPLQQESVNLLPRSDEQTPPSVEYNDAFLNDFPLEDDILLEEEIQRELEEVPSVARNGNVNLSTERIPHTYRSSCGSSLNETSEKDDGCGSEKPVEVTSKQKNLARTVSTGDGTSTGGSLQCNSVSQACSSAIVLLKNPHEERRNDLGPDESSCQSSHAPDSRQLNKDPVSSSKTDPEADQQAILCRPGNACDLDLDSPPFTYISLLLAKKPETITLVKVKCFIVTLTGNLTSSNGSWGIKAKVSDGSAYLEVDFADDILTSLIGFSVPEMHTLRKDPALQPKLKDGLERCQKQLIDLCCLMTIEFNPFQSKATVLILQDTDARHLEQLKKRLNK